MLSKCIVACCLSAVLATSVLVPTAMAQDFSAKSQVDQIDKVVTLTADQKTKLMKVYEDMFANMPQMGDFGGGQGAPAGGQGGQGAPRGGMMGGGIMMFGPMQEQVEGVLTADQVKKLRAYNLKQNVDRQITMIDQIVTLTADQKTKLTPAIEKAVTAQNEMMSGMMGGGGGGDMNAMMEKFTALREEQNAAMAKVLTKEQMTKYTDAMNQQMGGFGGGGF
jgi:hypothetical protein